MKTEQNILIAFILNLSFSVIEFFGGIITNSVAILSDSVHDLGDAISIGASFFLEKKSKKKADITYTYGYTRFSVLGGVITTTVLAVSSLLVIISAVKRVINPAQIDYDKMLIFAIIGVVLNTTAAFVTRKSDSINQKSVNLHMLEDVLGWIIVLIGALLMKFTDFTLIDPLMSIGVSVFILINAIKNLKQSLDVFLEKAPENIDIECLKEHLMHIENVDDIHHIHVWSIDGINNYATMHIVTKTENTASVKNAVREELFEHNIVHSVLETETEECGENECNPKYIESTHSHTHHRHH